MDIGKLYTRLESVREDLKNVEKDLRTLAKEIATGTGVIAQKFPSNVSAVADALANIADGDTNGTIGNLQDLLISTPGSDFIDQEDLEDGRTNPAPTAPTAMGADDVDLSVHPDEEGSSILGESTLSRFLKESRKIMNEDLVGNDIYSQARHNEKLAAYQNDLEDDYEDDRVRNNVADMFSDVLSIGSEDYEDDGDDGFDEFENAVDYTDFNAGSIADQARMLDPEDEPLSETKRRLSTALTTGAGVLENDDNFDDYESDDVVMDDFDADMYR